MTDQTPRKLDYLNLGCGSRVHPFWTNVDFVSRPETVIAHDLTKGIPFPEESFDVVYHSHLLEHFTRDAARRFLRECFRVLRPGGILRVVVPDLERIVRTYLVALEEASKGIKEWADNYDWILLEMYDQTVRNCSGGQMAAYFSKDKIPNRDFIINRCGSEIKNLMEHFTAVHQNQTCPDSEWNISRFFIEIGKYLNINHWRDLFIKLMLGDAHSALKIGRFRQSGEVHQWMYDRYSLKILLEECRFERIIEQSPTMSLIPFWINFNLDTEPDGSVYKPQSIFMEGVKTRA